MTAARNVGLFGQTDRRVGIGLTLATILLWAGATKAAEAGPLPGTVPLTVEGDLASLMIDGADRFLLRETEKTLARREQFWKRDFSSPEKYAASVEPNRRRLAHILGVRDARAVAGGFEVIRRLDQRDGEADEGLCVVRWPVVGDVVAEGLLLGRAAVPSSRSTPAWIIAIPDPAHTAEMIAGAVQGLPPQAQFARRLADSGCRVLVPTLVDRQTRKHRAALLTNREYIYRAAYELGRHVIGYEVQQVLAAVDQISREQKAEEVRIGVIGHGEGGLIALCAAALDMRIDAVCVSGYFADRRNLWQEPLDHNVFGLLEQFGDAELAGLVAPRPMIVEASAAVESEVPPDTGGGPGRIVTPGLDGVRREFQRARRLVSGFSPVPRMELIASGDGRGPFGTSKTLAVFLNMLSPDCTLAPDQADASRLAASSNAAVARQTALVEQLNRHSQQLLAASAEVRREFFKNLDTSSLEKFQKTIEPYREFFYNEVIGRFEQPPLPANPRSRKTWDEPNYTGYEVMLDVFPDLFAYGILNVPKDIRPGQRRPVIVCQHGLEGRPQDLIRGSSKKAYADFASVLADQGFITFAPQNPYILGDRFRTLQRKANPIKKTLFSLIVPQHQQIVNWLGTLPFVDKQRIAFYGLSYGGKTAMRVPPLVQEYCLSICSGDFNEWVWKNASVGNRYSYMGTKEYEIFEFDLGSTFNYAEMAALIAPRPFMVERGHFDGCAPDEMVGYEFAKVRFLYQARLGIGDRAAIEWWVGPHAIHGVGTYAFLHRWLGVPGK